MVYKDNTSENCGAENFRIANSASTPSKSGFTVQDNRFIGGTFGVVGSYASDILVKGNHITDISTHGVIMDNGVNVDVVENHLINIFNRGVQLESTVTSGSVRDNFIKGASAVGVRNQNAGVVIDGNTIIGATIAYDGSASLWRALPVNDPAPNIGKHKYWFTANTAPTAYNNFAGATDGQEISVIVRDTNTTFDFTGSNLKGNGGVDLAAAQNTNVNGRYNSSLFAWYLNAFKS